MYSKAVPFRTTMAKTFDGPPTLERSGSEHRRAVSLFFPEGRRPRREVEPSLMAKKDGMILEQTSLSVKKVSVPCEGNRKGRKDY